jgi:hypothetical protein
MEKDRYLAGGCQLFSQVTVKALRGVVSISTVSRCSRSMLQALTDVHCGEPESLCHALAFDIGSTGIRDRRNT